MRSLAEVASGQMPQLPAVWVTSSASYCCYPASASMMFTECGAAGEVRHAMAGGDGLRGGLGKHG